MRISRKSAGRRRKFEKIASNTLPRSCWDGSSFPCAGRLLLFVAAWLFVSSFNFLIHSDNKKDIRSLRSTRPKSTPTPESVVEATKQTNHRHSRRESLTAPRDASVILFYNIFIPDEVEGVKHAIEVMSEQVAQVASSLRRLEKNNQSAALFYNLIGNGSEFLQDKMKSLCSKLHSRLSCQQIGYFETASESVTLQEIHDFCQNDDAADMRVTYIHTKGSYHQTEVNTNWRRALTDSVVHPDCLFPPDEQCNLCGAQFYTRFATMYPGNMWTAQCSYIKRLLPPIEGGEYDERKKESIIKFLKYRLWGQLDSTLLDDRVDYFGIGRFRLEHWIGSHPSIQPCELHRKNVTFAHMIEGHVTSADYEWGMGPRRNEVVGEFPDARRRIEKDENAQFREYFFLPGNLLKWFTLYGSEGIPPQNSWAWDFFPAGDIWKKLVNRFGENAVEEMVTQSSHESHSAYDSDKNEGKQFQIDKYDEKLYVKYVSPLVVFYHVSIPKVKKLEALLALKTQLEVLSMGQYDIISHSYHRQRHVILYYTIAGDSSAIGFLAKICQDKSKQLTCRKVSEFDSERASGESLRHLHNFCIAKPSLSVTYLSNTLPGTYGLNKTEAYSIQSIRAYTTAITSKMCLKSRETCNVCGTEFYPLPFNHFIGNMFTASCEYVKDLLPPDRFERAMDAAAGDSLLSQLQGAITTELFPFTPRNLGLKQYSVEHWIGSHPHFEPCDVAPVRHSWFPFLNGGSYLSNEYISSRDYDFMWSKAPRRSSAPVGSLSPNREKEVREKDRTVFREYYYLAGNLLRWYKLYNKSPSQNSWVWKWHPKGKDWLEGAMKYGPKVVVKMSKPFWKPNEGVPF